MMRLRSLFLVTAGALATALIIGAAPDHTALNGVSLNGLSLNGVALNGTSFNGVRLDAGAGVLNAPLAELATRPLLR